MAGCSEQIANWQEHGVNFVSASGLMRFHSLPSVTGGITRLVCARIRESGIQLSPLLSRAGLTVEQIDNRSTRLKVQSQIRFLELAADALQDDFWDFTWRAILIFGR